VSVKSSWVECVDEIRRLEQQIVSAQSLLKMYSSRKLDYEKELLKNDDGVTTEEKHAYLLGIYYDPDKKPPASYVKHPTQILKEEILAMEKAEREEKFNKLKSGLSHISTQPLRI